MIDDVAGPAMRVAGLRHELLPGLRAAGDPRPLLGYYLPPFAYARMQVLQQAIEATGGLDQDKLADYLRSHTFGTVVGDIKFGPNGEWAEARTLEVQFQGVQGNSIDQFRNPVTEAILWPASEQNGALRLPYNEAQY